MKHFTRCIRNEKPPNKMDVIGNNIANVNTYGYKTQRTTFRDIYYQTMKNPGAPSDDASVVRRHQFIPSRLWSSGRFN